MKKTYTGIQSKLVIEFKNDKELPLGDLLEFEASISNSVRKMIECETKVLGILEDKTLAAALSQHEAEKEPEQSTEAPKKKAPDK